MDLYDALSDLLSDKPEMKHLKTVDGKTFVSYLTDIFEKQNLLNKQLQGSNKTLVDAKKKLFGFVTFIESLVYADKPQTLDHLEDNIRRVIADIRLQMLEKVIENGTSRSDYIRASRGSPMREIIFKM
ncbi:SCAN domain-containing protein 3 [Trichonephila clavipes]|uniref:SCAN domain-containing protein 3 n=1 Tax=Trichonephila clavipes TaxID=2585209 RepID=A0A8X7BJQ4_TRICX|nr:SCAN domain-containing protein 3 [Trichonephila clavipes]